MRRHSAPRRVLSAVPCIGALTFAVAACSTDDGRTMQPPSPEQVAATTTTTEPPTTLPAPITAPDIDTSGRSGADGSPSADSSGSAPTTVLPFRPLPRISTTPATAPPTTLAAGAPPPTPSAVAPVTAAGTATAVPGIATPPTDGATTTVPGAVTPPPSGSAVPTTVATPAMALTAPWADGQAIDPRFSCTGGDLSPAISWSALPAGTVEVAIQFVDSDADNYIHWRVARINPAIAGFDEAAPPRGIVQGINSARRIGYAGPCPPAGVTHTYQLTVYALRQASGLRANDDIATWTATLESLALSTATVTGTFTGA